MRAIWSGVISFGMVTVPVKMFGATEEKRVAFHQVHAADGGRVRQKRVCELDGEEVSLSDVAKGYQLPDGDVVVLTSKDFEGLPEAIAKTISVEAFVPEEQIDPIMYSKSYYLAPDKLGVRPYALLRDAMSASGRVAVVRFAMRERESLAALRVREGVLVLETMLWADEIRKPDFDFLDSKVEPKNAELKMAELLIDSLSTDFDPAEYQDSYREALEEVIEAKVAGREVVTPPAPAEGGAQVIDLMAALKASVEAAKKTRGGEGETGKAEKTGKTEKAEKESAKPAAKKTAAAKKSAAAKKTAASASKSAATPSRAAKGARGTAKTADLHKPARKKPATKSTSTRRSA
ncbi:Ku protein [Catenulispora acidiphila DSM 44928]|uniref:Non-homologous end joining protein Ku n=1 Tax=Catenulispora acidiphila (strain DSM 44928 / JCM 14897 / NBRC 102108 / NRRL B-24433 / ID139908) TaxID=479433 RepID=C7Q6S1_CATAD|nr:Ku protein [Catenulispora acidiphila]ACU74106.1 Ku protein [Catenulispora acidiphila DSM 44928]